MRKFSRIMNRHTEASKNISFFFGIRATGELFTAYYSGKLLEMMKPRTGK
jgi:hypothetical protein